MVQRFLKFRTRIERHITMYDNDMIYIVCFLFICFIKCIRRSWDGDCQFKSRLGLQCRQLSFHEMCLQVFTYLHLFILSMKLLNSIIFIFELYIITSQNNYCIHSKLATTWHIEICAFFCFSFSKYLRLILSLTYFFIFIFSSSK